MPVHVELVLPVADIVGESPVWSPEEAALYWVDIVGRRIHRWHSASERHETWPTPEMPTSIGLAENRSFVVGLERRVALWRPNSEFITLAEPEPGEPLNRLNEGVVAPDGSFWVGTMENNIAPNGSPSDIKGAKGALYRIDGHGGVRRLSSHRFGITNTMIWREDGTFLTADTLSNELLLFDIAAGGDRLLNGRLIGPRISRGLPDGSTVLADGRVINARVAGGHSVALFDRNLRDATMIELSCSSPTACTFGGEELDVLYVTSARFGMTAGQIEANPTEGALFRVTGLGKGLPTHKFRIAT